MRYKIIIPVFNNWQFTRDCIESIITYTEAYKTPYLIVIVDNGSTDNTDNYLKSAIYQNNRTGSSIMVLRNKENLGFVKAVNQGITFLKGYDADIIMNNDVKVSRGWLEKIEKAFTIDDVGLTTLITNTGASLQNYGRLRNFLPGIPKIIDFDERKNIEDNNFVLENHYRGKILYNIPNIVFSLCAIRADVVNDVGALDENLGLGLGDDDDYCIRARLQGYKCALCLDGYYYHYHRRTFRLLDRKDWQEQQFKNIEYLRQKHGDDKVPASNPEMMTI